MIPVVGMMRDVTVMMIKWMIPGGCGGIRYEYRVG